MKLSGAAGFDSYYSRIYQERWPQLREALQRSAAKIELSNPFASEGAEPGYILDPSSIVPTRELEGDRILDLCAAPGGKALATLFRLPNAHIVANEMSLPRLKRLKAVLKSYLPAARAHQIQTLHADGSRLYRRFASQFDSVLVDAPCSGERHLFDSAKDMNEWSPNRSRGLVIRQMGLLCSALEMVREGGVLVYSTCSIHPDENQDLIARFLKKREGRVVVEPTLSSAGEAQTFGRLILPDVTDSQGPLYFCRLKRVAATSQH